MVVAGGAEPGATAGPLGAKLTLGALWAVEEAWNICIGLESRWNIAQNELGKVLNSRL